MIVHKSIAISRRTSEGWPATFLFFGPGHQATSILYCRIFLNVSASAFLFSPVRVPLWLRNHRCRASGPTFSFATTYQCQWCLFCVASEHPSVPTSKVTSITGRLTCTHRVVVGCRFLLCRGGQTNWLTGRHADFIWCRSSVALAEKLKLTS